jgi:DNA-binding GntR family transcriptional regulator
VSVEPGRSAWRSYLHIADVLRARIRAGIYPPGTLLPSERTLAAEFGVVRNTLRRALTDLDREDLVETVPGRGRLVRAEHADPAGTRLRYRRIAVDLSAAIVSGELRPGDALPSEADLVRRYQTSRGTVRQALAELAAAGLVETRQGRARRVRPV